MLASELIIALKKAIEEYGDQEVRKWLADWEYGNYFDVEVTQVTQDEDKKFLYLKEEV